MTDAAYKQKDIGIKRLDLLIKVVVPLITLTGIFVGVYQFTSQQAANDRLEFKRKLLDKRLTVYTDLCNSASKAVNSTQSDTLFSKSVTEFYTVYWGAAIFITDSVVAEAMFDFNMELQDFIQGVSRIEDPHPELRLKTRLKILADKCRESLHKNWKDEFAYSL